jgi:hypothetical protein
MQMYICSPKDHPTAPHRKENKRTATKTKVQSGLQEKSQEAGTANFSIF